MGAEFWVAVSFFCFIGILFYMKVPSMLGQVLDDRAEGIRKELDEARRLREEAQELLADYQQKQRRADDEAKAIVEEAEREAQALKVQAEKSLKETLERRARIAEEKIARAEAQAVAEVRAAVVEAASKAAEQVLTTRVQGKTAGNLLDQSIQELKGKLN